MNGWLVYLATAFCCLLLFFSVAWLMPILWQASRNIHIKHRWQGRSMDETSIYAGGSRPKMIVYYQWFECSECGREKLKKIGVKS